ncbi:thiamine diphosphokinase [Cohnella pontilimi]|uniref:Thiamine diphosphokinase n=1 Tax=Cohnella pontilimi TaxID=2564100 RepID=A0A4U0FID7_9BACL|nr:thiamine diphosphokinase [Cohnella pontilimi]TJY44214.1 thiamine diphosphokinase [Cohnella pontilimi]
MSDREHSRRSKAVIFTGGTLGEWAMDRMTPEAFLIGADRGAEFLVRHGVRPHLALGDFDSVTAEQRNEIAEFSLECLACDPVDKDWTDTELAIREAVSRGYRHIEIVGGLGTRFDHSLANVHLLRQLAEQGCEGRLIDEHNEIRLCKGELRLEADSRYKYVSLLPLSMVVKGVTLEGFQYPLTDATLTLGWSLGVSNVLMDAQGRITLSEGQLLVIRSRD